MKRNTFFRKWNCLGLLVAVLFVLSAAQAQGVPGAIKYQAVLRDVNGKTLVNKNDVNIRISLRLDEPVAGTIAYSEVHEGVSTNAYGVIHLEIGRGEVTSGTALNAIAWGEHKVYVQVEIETDGTGYTHMGNAELLTVPYAFYAENTSGKNLYENLKDNFLPKYNEANKTLVNSGLSQTGRALEVDGSSVTFVDRGTGKPGYTFPMAAGKKGQVLRLADDKGTLIWDTAGGGGGIGGGTVIELEGDGKMVYWNGRDEALATAPFRFDYGNTQDFILTGDLTLDGTVTGNNNLLTSNGLGDGQIWIGDNNSILSSSLTPRRLSGHVLMDKEGKTSLNLELKGIALIPGTDRDTLRAESDSLWRRNEVGNIYAYNQGKDLEQTFVGIGTDAPETMLHVHSGAVQFTGKTDSDGKLPVFSWNPEKSSLFAGAVSDMTTFGNQGNYSIALGLDALAAKDYGLALGKESNVQGEEAVAIGVQSSASAKQSVALGRSAKVVGGSAGVAIGYLTEVQSNNAVVLGGNSKASTNSVVIGYSNGSVTPIDESIVIGMGNTMASNAIVIGRDILGGDNNILIGNSLSGQQYSVVVGSNVDKSRPSGQTVLGYSCMDGPAENFVSIGNGNQYTNTNYYPGGVPSPRISMIGTNLTLTNPSSGYMTMIGHNFSSDNLWMSETAGETPSFAFGSGMVVPFEISYEGNAFFEGDLTHWGALYDYSDIRLKTDIKPLFFTPALLDSLQSVSFVYKSDKKRRTRFGFIAQEVRKVFPELVSENAKGMLRMDYIGLVPVLWQINGQLSHKVDELEEQLKEQNRKQLELENELQAIKAKLGM